MKRLHISDEETYLPLHGRLSYLHGRRAESSAAFYDGEKKALELQIPRLLGTDSVYITVFSEGGDRLIEKELDFFSLSSDLDVYRCDLSLGIGLYFFSIKLSTASGILFVKKNGKGIVLSKNEELFQLSVSEAPKSTLNPYIGGIIYHVFVDRFKKDEGVVPKKGTIICDKWDVIPEYPEYAGAPMKNNTFFGGTLRSVTKELDYIKSLGVNLIYLSPIFDSPSNHKYDTADYLRVDEMFGGDEALSELITEAKKRGIGIILDGVFNHTGADSIYFNRYGTYPTLGAYQSKQSNFYGWYTFNSHPDDYVSWWGIEILPRINTGNPSFESFILDKVIPKYRDMGIAGMRLDVADELSDDFIKRIKKALSEKGDTLLYGEVWEDASNKIAYGKRKRYYLGKELDGVMNYPLREGIIRYIKNADTSALLYALNDVTDNAPKHIRNAQMNVLGTHDTERIITVLGGESAIGKSNKELSSLRMKNEEREYATVLLKSAYTVMATLPGIPSIFYADEAGLEGYSDPFNRMPYPTTPCKELLSHYRKIGEIRRNSPVYADGDFELITLTDELLVFSRCKDSDVYLTVYNNSFVPYSVDFEKATEELTEGVKIKVHRIPQKTAKIFKTTKYELINLI